MTRVAWFHCFSGIAGDMALGALIDAGADVDHVRSVCDRLAVDGWSLEAESVLRCGVAGTKAHVGVPDEVHHRSWSTIDGLIAAAGLPERVERDSRSVFRVLAEAEGRVHGIAAADVTFHEVGALDSIIDIVGVCAALDDLDIDEVMASGLIHGSGTIRAAHGTLPNPPPAVVELSAGVPTRQLPDQMELTTPTGAALLVALGRSWGPMPPLTLAASGFGAGGRDTDGRPNHVQVVIGDTVGPVAGASGPTAATNLGGHPVVLLETNVDDVTGEVLGHVVAELLEAGAHDAWLVQVVGKKGRPATIVSALVDPVDVDRLRVLMADETGSLGVRASHRERWPATRHFDTVEIDGHRIGIKVSGRRAKAEHDDAANAAKALGRPLRDITTEAEAIWQSLNREEAAEEPR